MIGGGDIIVGEEGNVVGRGVDRGICKLPMLVFLCLSFNINVLPLYSDLVIWLCGLLMMCVDC